MCGIEKEVFNICSSFTVVFKKKSVTIPSVDLLIAKLFEMYLNTVKLFKSHLNRDISLRYTTKDLL